MKICAYGHSCFSVRCGSKTLLFDPFISPNSLASHIKVDDVTADVILVSHGHEDHLADCVKIALRTKALVISGFEIVQWLSKQGVTNICGMNIGGKVQFDFGTVKMINATHSSSFPDGSYAGAAAGFLIKSGVGNFYYSGDTALTYDMKLIAADVKLDFAALPIGDAFTMGAEDAALAASWVGAKKVLGLHYDTFPEIRINKTEARAAFETYGIELHLPAPGQQLEL